MARRSIYSREQRLAPGTYENPLADFLNSLPDYINEFQQNQLKLGRQQLEDKRYEDALTATKAQRIEEQKRYNQEQTRLAQKTAYDKSRQKVADAVTAAKEVRAIKKAEDDKETKNLTLTLSSLNDEQKLPYLISRKGLDGDDTADLKIIQKSTDDFNLSLRPIIDIAPAGNIKNINKSLLDINTFMEKNEDNPLFKASSSAYTKVITKRDKLLTRLNQVSSDGYVDPKYWTQVDPTRGKVAKELYDKSVENIGAYASEKALTDDLSMQKTLDAKINKELANQETIRQGFKLTSIPEIKKEETENMAFSKLNALMQMNPAGGQSIAAGVSSPSLDGIPEEPPITEAEMDDVSKQLAMDQGEIESNLAKINETIPGLATATPTDTTAITNENITALTGDEAEAYNPNKVGLDPNDPSTVPASFLEPITDGGDEAPEVVDTTPEVEVADTGGLGNSAITDRLFPEQVSATTIDPTINKGGTIDDALSTIKVGDKSTESTKPPTEENIRRRDINEKILKKNDKSYEEGFSKHNEIQDSNIRDIEGKKINLDSVGKFNKQINSMVKRVKKLQMRGGLSTSSQAKLKERQNVYEQKQIVEDLLELKDRISDLPKYIYINKVVRGRETGEISKVETKRFKQSIENALKGDKYTRGLPKFLRYEDVITPSKASVSSESLINENYDWTKTDDDIINFIKNSRERPYYKRNQSGNNLRNQNIKSVLSG